MTKSPWFWLAILFGVVLLVWLWHRHRMKVLVVTKPGIGTPLNVQATAPAPTSVFSTVQKDVTGIFGGLSSIFSSSSGGS